MRVLITGANGFIGSHLADIFLECRFKVRCLVRYTADLRWLEGKNLEIQRCSGLNDSTAIGDAVRNVDILVHAAGSIAARTPQEYDHANAEPVRLLLDACRKNGAVQRFVLIGSQGAAGPNSDVRRPSREDDACHPISAYGKSKLKAEEVTKACSGHIPFTIVRPSVVYGPRDPHLFRIFKAAQKTGMFYYFGTGEKLLSLLHVQDLARGILLAATSGRSASQIYFLGSEQFYGLSDIRAALESALGRRVRAVKVPEAIKQLMMMYADLLNGVLRRKLLLDRDRLTTLGYPAWTCDVSKAKKDLGFEQTFALADGFERTFKWYRQHEWL